jgi:uncharacterized RDD family membrane protein YckC
MKQRISQFIPGRVAILGLVPMILLFCAYAVFGHGNPLYAFIALGLSLCWNLILVMIFYCKECKRRAPVDNWLYYSVFGALMIQSCPSCNQEPFDRVEKVGKNTVSPVRLRLMADFIDTLIGLFLGTIYISAFSNPWANASFVLTLHTLGWIMLSFLMLVGFARTPGNILTGTKLVNSSGDKPNFKDILLWNCIDFTLILIYLTSLLVYIYQLDQTRVVQINSVPTLGVAVTTAPKKYTIASNLISLWLFGNGLYLLYNLRRQTIADRIAGIWVVCVK